ncbi:glycosyltransferase [Nitrospira lenta]|uniref:Putative glycosyltransferase n=1 Tax=Nitrospira lenta TaxID=1436998 RepID=A0A330L1X4_9BACT|nr:glycosyltransferase [Nitrospira lenta]SPP63634.1 putative glycosyltransferase [Nitrospira lenta]
MKKERPFISIVIPTYNRPDQLAVCLRACSRLDYPHDRFEVIVVDDGGLTPLDEVVKPFQGVLTLTLLRQENAGPATARNKGAIEASGDFLIFTDDDCAPAPNWLETLAVRFAASPDSAVGGETYNALTQNLYSAASQLLVSYLLAYYSGAPERVRFFPSCNLAFPAKPFRDIGGFDLSFPRSAGEDRELCDRWQHRGYRLMYAPEAVVYHAHHLTAKTFLRQHFHYGGGAYYYHRLRARQRQQPMKVESPGFYVKMLAYPFGKIPFGKAMLVVPLLVVAQAVNAVGFFWERARGKKRMTGLQYPAI